MSEFPSEISAGQQKILSVLQTDCAFPQALIAAMVGRRGRVHSHGVRKDLLELEKRGLVRRLDDEKPVVWIRVTVDPKIEPVAIGQLNPVPHALQMGDHIAISSKQGNRIDILVRVDEIGSLSIGGYVENGNYDVEIRFLDSQRVLVDTTHACCQGLEGRILWYGGVPFSGAYQSMIDWIDEQIAERATS